MKHISLLLLCLCFFINGKSQDLPKSIEVKFWSSLAGFLGEQDKGSLYRRPTELAFAVFETDSTGKIASIHIKGDPGDSIYQRLRRMPSKVFDGIQSREIANRLIILPFYLYYYVEDSASTSSQKPACYSYREMESFDLMRYLKNQIFLKAVVWGTEAPPRGRMPVGPIKRIPVFKDNRNDIPHKR